MLKLSKGLLSFISGLGFMGLVFYLVFFTFVEMDYLLLLRIEDGLSPGG